MQAQRFDAGSDAIGVWPQVPMNNDQFDMHSQPFKRARNSEDNQSSALPCPPMNSRMNSPNPQVNRGTSNIFFKTKMCTSFMAGMCSKGADCKYAHGIEDMRQPPPNWQELAGLRGGEDRSTGHWDDDQKIIHKMKLCKKFYNGEECPYGERCNFLHEDPAKFRGDSGRFRESSAISIGTNESSVVHGAGSNQSDTSRPLNNGSDAVRSNTKPYLKTKICNSWERGQCHYGDKCHFAHGQAELRAPIEGEASSMGFIPISAKPQYVPLRDASPPKTRILPTSTEEGRGQKSLLKWKGFKKIDRIYADWLDDVPLAQHLPSKVES
ncbi:zinc finger CCCH domain-containing protein 39 isoform X1 [Juglans microcarpa x Juglans regia]|uniref:zinc finger CCCH domain-containing protein 39 isoform X1 n=2 Tax=Juglans microcarpa x Juglans regia TaxID=2249226 RepID=UPI001B7DC217|nr:zinc finger CCCH domain-containing protein 39 isoform X1 [Juglans microcarpa x Juglans regia]